MGMEISPMSDLANNFSSSTLSPSPWRLSGKVGPSCNVQYTIMGISTLKADNTFSFPAQEAGFQGGVKPRGG